jgi:hypothetical protein
MTKLQPQTIPNPSFPRRDFAAIPDSSFRAGEARSGIRCHPCFMVAGVRRYAKLHTLFFLLLILLASCAGPQQQVLRTERDYQRAFNDACFDGKARMEVSVKYGRVDLVTGEYAIEVDRLENFHEAIGQALHYAKETGKKPAVAFFISDPKPGDDEKLKYVTRLCNSHRIKVWFINEELEKAVRRNNQ